jgi:dolichol-phosphate mannosyltransferase
MTHPDFAVVVPMANESADFSPFVNALSKALDLLGGTVYLVVDNASKDNTRELCEELSRRDPRFKTVYAPENKNVVDAYLRGYREAYNNGHPYILEMDAGLSHDPKAIPLLLQPLLDGCDCAFGSRFIKGGAIHESSFRRKFLSQFGTILSNVLLGSRLRDMTSGFQGFKAATVKQILDYGLRSKAHFYQTEVRYLLRRKKYVEVPILYRAPSPSVSKKAIYNSIEVLLFYFMRRITFRAEIIA